MKFILTIIFLFISNLRADENWEYAIINDPDGYTFIRDGQDKSSAIVDTLFDGEFFRYNSSNSNWIKVLKAGNIYAYVHKSRILPLVKIKKEEQRKLIDSIFDIEKLLFFDKSINRKKSLKFHDEKFYPIQSLFIHYMKYNYDEELFIKFYDLPRWGDDEVPIWTMGYLFLDNPEKLLRYAEKQKDKSLFWFYKIGFNEITFKEQDNPEFDKLKERAEILLDLYDK